MSQSVDEDAPSPWGVETKIEFKYGPFRVNFTTHGQGGNTILPKHLSLECALSNITIHAFSLHMNAVAKL